jgi:hypothetical protein
MGGEQSESSSSTVRLNDSVTDLRRRALVTRRTRASPSTTRIASDPRGIAPISVALDADSSLVSASANGRKNPYVRASLQFAVNLNIPARHIITQRRRGALR